ncbi:uncharacterized protein LOC134268556 [Saccostrea cucullata]|uniref:uncharacterized protein LOC134268556 n=1 Tax=Saccostrea cuccullata TaxID=36930 RepID=UPI002ED03061
MSRSVAWRRTCNDLVFWRQCQALDSTIYILRETGPTGFLLKEEGEAKPVKVFLGDPHSCTCSNFMKDRDLCKHICWLILKKFKVPQDNPVTWQLGLVEREINEILFGTRQRKPQRRWATSAPPDKTGQLSDGRPTIQQREIKEEDCCPICQDELLQKHQPVTFCKFSCGNSIHIKCMKIWADHQKSSGEKTIKCPFCREDFGPFELLKQESRNAMGVPTGGRMDRHLYTRCQSCHASPIEGKCYRCTACTDFHLCQTCFNTSIHTSHPFEYRHKRNQRWRPAQRTYGAVLPEAVANDLLNREFTEGDYELLTQLDSNANQQPSDIPEDIIHKFPLEKVRERGPLLAPGMQCRICLRGYEVNQYVRKLPRCKHKFHKECIDNWLLHSHPTCPVDGQVVWDPVTAQLEAEEQAERNQRAFAASKKTNSSGIQGNDVSELSIPGVGLVRVDNTPVERSSSLRGRKMAQQGRLQGRQAEDTAVDPLRASFTLNGLSVGANGGEGTENVSTTTTLPGGRLLGRLQHRKSSLNQRLQEIGGQSDEQKHTEEADHQSQSSEHFAGQNLHRQNSRRRRNLSDELSHNEDSHEIGSEAVIELPLGHKNDRATTHNAIKNTLSMLQTENLANSVSKTPDSSRSSRSPSVRSLLHSRPSELHSPNKDLPPLFESDETNPNADIDIMSTVTSQGASSYRSGKHRFFQRVPKENTPAVVNDFDVLLTSLRSSPDSRASLMGSHTSLSSIRSTRLANGVILAEAQDEGPEGGLSRGHSGGPRTGLPPRAPRLSEHERQLRRGSNSQEVNQAGAQNQQEDQLMERLQLFTDLYLGNSPTASPDYQGRAPRLVRRQISNPAAVRQRKRENEIRRRRTNEFGLEGTSPYNNLTLRDIIH